MCAKSRWKCWAVVVFPVDGTAGAAPRGPSWQETKRRIGKSNAVASSRCCETAENSCVTRSWATGRSTWSPSLSPKPSKATWVVLTGAGRPASLGTTRPQKVRGRAEEIEAKAPREPASDLGLPGKTPQCLQGRASEGLVPERGSSGNVDLFGWDRGQHLWDWPPVPGQYDQPWCQQTQTSWHTWWVPHSGFWQRGAFQVEVFYLRQWSSRGRAHPWQSLFVFSGESPVDEDFDRKKLNEFDHFTDFRDYIYWETAQVEKS